MVVHEQHRRQGLANYLINQLKPYARNLGIEGFYSEILQSNEAMLEFHRKLNHSLEFNEEHGVFHVKTSFKQEDIEAAKGLDPQL